jgi:hypothetical protein
MAIRNADRQRANNQIKMLSNEQLGKIADILCHYFMKSAGGYTIRYVDDIRDDMIARGLPTSGLDGMVLILDKLGFVTRKSNSGHYYVEMKLRPGRKDEWENMSTEYQLGEKLCLVGC